MKTLYPLTIMFRVSLAILAFAWSMASNAQTPISISQSITPISCSGFCNGAISLTASGGLAPYNFQWSNGSTGDSVGGLCAGSYHVTISDANYTPVSLPWTYMNTGGTHSIGIHPVSPGTTIIAAGIQIGDYIGAFYLDDNNQPACGGYVKIISGNMAFGVWRNDPTTTVKDGFNPGEPIQLKVWKANNGDVHPVTASYSSLAPSQGFFVNNGLSIIDSITGTYTPSNNASYPAFHSLSLADGGNILLSSVISDYNGYAISVAGGNDGSIEINASGGIAPYAYLWSNGGSTSFISNLTAGTYSVTVVDAVLCLSNATFTLSEPLPVSALSLTYQLSNYNGYQISGYGLSDASIDITVSGGIPPYTYLWSNGATSEDLFNLPAGNYSVTVQDGTQSLSQNFVLNQPLPPNNALTVIDSITNNACYGDCTGSIELQITGGNTNHYYLWSDGETIANRYNVCAGTYHLTISDSAAMVSASLPWTFEYAGYAHLIALDASAGAISINGIDLMTGDVVGVFFENNGNLLCGGYTTWTGNNISITAWGSNNNNTTDVVPSFSPNDSIYWKVWRHSDGIIVDMIPEYQSGFPQTGLFAPGGISAIGALHGTVNTNLINSSISFTYEITEPDALLVFHTASLIDTLTGTPGNINLMIFGGTSPYSILWNNGETNTNLSTFVPGNYSVIITDSLSCEFMDTISLDYQVTQNLIYTAQSSGISCFGSCDGEIEIIMQNGNPPYSFLWSNGETNSNITALCPGTYSLTIQDMAHTDTLVLNLTEPSVLQLSANLSMVDPLQGNDGAIDISISGGTPPYQFLWTNGGSTEDISGLTVGNYSLSIFDSNACSIQDTFQLEYAYIIDPLLVQSSQVDCSCFSLCDGTAELMVQGGIPPYEFAWSNGGTSAMQEQLCAGIYEITVSSLDTQLVYSIEIIEPDPIQVQADINPVDPFNLITGSIDLVISGGTPPYQFLWSDGSSSINLAEAEYGNHSLTISDDHGCSFSDTFFVDIPFNPGWSIPESSEFHTLWVAQDCHINLVGSQASKYDILGVFYEDSGTLHCGGYAIWLGDLTPVFAWKDNPLSSTKDGFEEGELIQWKVWDASENAEYPATASYETNFPNTDIFYTGGTSSIDSLYTVSMSGSVSTSSKSTIDDGIVVLYLENADTVKAAAKTRIVNGNFTISGLEKGSYLAYAIPNPTQENAIPGYFPNHQEWENALRIEVKGHIDNQDILLENNTLPEVGIGSISGLITLGENHNYNPDIHNSEWFPGFKSNNPSAGRNIPILLLNSNQIAIDFTLSNENGMFSFEDLSLGKYFIRPESTGNTNTKVEVTLSEAYPNYDQIHFLLENGETLSLLDSKSKAPWFTVYPNPSHGVFFIGGNTEVHSLSLFDLSGRELAVSLERDLSLCIKLESYPPGIYFLQVHGSHGSSIHRLVKK